MIAWPLRIAFRCLGRKVRVPISQCVHYGAFRYGRDEPHPYETYMRKLAQAGDRGGARAWFVEFLRHYRPRHFGEAIGAPLQQLHGLWHFPWVRRLPAGTGWYDDPLNFPDIVTQFCEEGILWFRIEQEFFWLERALYSIRRFGYRPGRGPGITARKFVAADGSAAYLILDGNHRIGALAALGYESVELRYLPRSSVHERQAGRWPQVRAGRYSEQDARRVLRAYFDGNRRWRTTEKPASLLEHPV